MSERGGGGFEVVDFGLKLMSVKSIEPYNITKNYPDKYDFLSTVTAMLAPMF